MRPTTALVLFLATVAAALGVTLAYTGKVPARPAGQPRVKLAVLVSPLYLDFVQVLACAYLVDMGFDWVKHDPIVERRRGPRHGDAIEGMVLEGTPLAPLIDDLAHAVLAHRRSGREMPEALRVFADFFGPVPSGATPPPSDV